MVGLQKTWRATALMLAFCAISGVCSLPAGAGDQGDVTTTCTKAEFEAVVDDAAASLRDLNANNKPEFQDKLRVLKEKRGWSHDEFMAAAAPFVKDDKIDDWDRQSAELLDKIAAMGQEGSAAKTPDCALLDELHGRMKALVDAQTAKWTYMFAKIDAELAK